MSLRVAYVGLWVHDQDEALAFYTERLGFELRSDVSLPEMGGYRWLTVGPPGQPDIAFTLNVPAPPVFDEQTAAEVRTAVAQGRMGGFILNCDDCRATYEELRGRGVEFSQEPTEVPYGIDAAFRDVSGNQIRLVQPAPAYA
ncbi:VOC family protein [Miltoncostaea marina]|uniref:VOC family protein n=1 Tax=Miltoncostaea marina TaxID=2843215 RepID=UPI001C3DAE2A|nr:VOC family protein [Miltoncostaea marina]